MIQNAKNSNVLNLEDPVFLFLVNLPFTGKWTAQISLGKVCSWGKLCLALLVGDTRAHSTRTNNYCTKGESQGVRMKHSHMLMLLSPRINKMGIIHY